MATFPKAREIYRGIAGGQINEKPEIPQAILGIYPYEKLENIPLTVKYLHQPTVKPKKYKDKVEGKSLENAIPLELGNPVGSY